LVYVAISQDLDTWIRPDNWSLAITHVTTIMNILTLIVKWETSLVDQRVTRPEA